LLTDVVMPGGIDGVTLVREARRQRPKLKALLTSGYMVGNVPGQSGAGADDLPLLTKPYDHADLARAIHEALGQLC
jgi:CheY-like chemotaxis protein